MINLYNANTEKEQIEVLSNLFALLKTFDIDPNKHIIMAGDFNLFFNSKLDAVGSNLVLKRKSLVKLIELAQCIVCEVTLLSNINQQVNLLLSLKTFYPVLIFF